jgi:hypothetical protein
MGEAPQQLDCTHFFTWNNIQQLAQVIVSPGIDPGYICLPQSEK